jgi:signal transduction histidine kinase
MNRTGAVNWLWRPAWGIRDVGAGDLLLGAGLSVFMLGLIGGWLRTSGGPQGGLFASVAALTMTLPVIIERRSPLTAAVVVALATAFNELVVGHLIRCGPALPAVLVIGYFVGTRCTGRQFWLAALCCLTGIALQSVYDPQLGPSFMVIGVLAMIGFCGAGRLARSRSRLAAALRTRNAELRDQRDQTARLAAAAERTRVAGDLDGFLQDQIGQMNATVAAGRELLSSDPVAAQQAFADVESQGRATLAQMREVAGILTEQAPTQPQPTLAQLASLLERTTTADARLHVAGSPRVLPAGLELSGYRIVEQLLAALGDTPDARIDVRVSFRPDALELHVTGPVGAHGEQSGAVAAARERAALHDGTLRLEARPGGLAAFVRLPLPAQA